MTRTDPLPTTEAEAHRWIARRVFRPHDLLAAYSGGHPTAFDCGGAGRGYMWQARGRTVDYKFDGGPTGSVKTRALERLAAASATRGAVDRLTAALAAHAAEHRDAERRFGPFWEHTREVTRSPAWIAHTARAIAAEREINAARAAWWDGQPGVQLDLFGAAS